VLRGHCLPVGRVHLDRTEAILVCALAEKGDSLRTGSTIFERRDETLVRFAEAQLVVLATGIARTHVSTMPNGAVA
jgi:hypothetical protein